MIRWLPLFCVGCLTGPVEGTWNLTFDPTLPDDCPMDGYAIGGASTHLSAEKSTVKLKSSTFSDGDAAETHRCSRAKDDFTCELPSRTLADYEGQPVACTAQTLDATFESPFDFLGTWSCETALCTLELDVFGAYDGP